LIKSSATILRRENFRMVRVGPRRDSGEMIAFTREPSFRRASTIGELSSMRRPSDVTMRSIAPSTARSLVKVALDSSSRPPRSTQISSKRLTMISVTLSSAIIGSSGPRPTASSSTSCVNNSVSMPSGRLMVEPSTSLIRLLTLAFIVAVRPKSSTSRGACSTYFTARYMSSRSSLAYTRSMKKCSHLPSWCRCFP